ncbi:hypothetical protein [Coriobacterium glomerans]|nr:hypothetical protein [Coriobacterium glomerans]
MMSSEAPSGDRPKHSRKTILITVIVAIVVLGLVAGGAWCYLGWRHQQDAAADEKAYADAHRIYDVNLKITADGLDTSEGSKIPVQVSGTDFEGNKVEKIYYVASDGSGISLMCGRYDLSIAASPISADGMIFNSNDVAVHATVGKNGTFDVEGSFTLSPIEADQVSAAQINEAYLAAKEGGAASEKDAATLRDAATRRREDAIRKKRADADAEAKRVAEERAASVHFSTSRFSFDIPDYWKDRVTVSIDEDCAHVFSKKYPEREIMAIVVSDGGNLKSGSQMIEPPAVDIGGGRYAQVQATDWAIKIAEANISHSKRADDFFSLDEANELTDLQTGGGVGYISVLRALNTSDGNPDSKLLSRLSAFISDTVPRTIKSN